MSFGGTSGGSGGMRSPFSAGYGQQGMSSGYGSMGSMGGMGGYGQPQQGFSQSQAYMQAPMQNQQYQPMGNAYAYGQQRQPMGNAYAYGQQGPQAPSFAQPMQGGDQMFAQMQRARTAGQQNEAMNPGYGPQAPSFAQPQGTRSLYEQQMGIFPNGQPQAAPPPMQQGIGGLMPGGVRQVQPFSQMDFGNTTGALVQPTNS